VPVSFTAQNSPSTEGALPFKYCSGAIWSLGEALTIDRQGVSTFLEPEKHIIKPGNHEFKLRPRSKPEEYDLLLLGSGTAGKLLSWTLPKEGMKTADIERKYVGGSCQNIACLPSKDVIHSAKVASYFRRSEEFGITKDNWKINMPAVRERKRKMVASLVELQLDLYEKSGAELVMGSGRFVEPRTHRRYFCRLALHASFTASGSSSTRAPMRPSVLRRACVKRTP
jgi:hypothetical protein